MGNVKTPPPSPDENPKSQFDLALQMQELWINAVSDLTLKQQQFIQLLLNSDRDPSPSSTPTEAVGFHNLRKPEVIDDSDPATDPDDGFPSSWNHQVASSILGSPPPQWVPVTSESELESDMA